MTDITPPSPRKTLLIITVLIGLLGLGVMLFWGWPDPSQPDPQGSTLAPVINKTTE